ncbi:MAG TPA: hypothetical protein VM074_10065 [Solimonas sp.]|nr:hypothetical protein [Solimonas sp.]
MSGRRNGLLAALLFASAACVPQNIQLQDSLQDTRRLGGRGANRSAALIGECAVQLGSISDARGDRSGLGDLGKVVEVQQPDFGKWVASGFELLLAGSPGSAGAVPATASLPGAIRIDAELLKTYVNLNGTSKAATVVVRTRFMDGSALLLEQVYRGNESFVNWSSSAEEMQSALDYCLREILTAARDDLGQLCAARAPAARTAEAR